jgi:predicted RNase H-like HicB family nuclease
LVYTISEFALVLQLQIAFAEGAGGFNPLKMSRYEGAFRPGSAPPRLNTTVVLVVPKDTVKKGRALAPREVFLLFDLSPRAVNRITLSVAMHCVHFLTVVSSRIERRKRTPRKETATVQDIAYTVHTFKEAGAYVAYVPELDVSSCGATNDEARKNIKDAVLAFLETSAGMVTLVQNLEEAGYERKGERWKAPEFESGLLT